MKFGAKSLKSWSVKELRTGGLRWRFIVGFGSPGGYSRKPLQLGAIQCKRPKQRRRQNESSRRLWTSRRRGHGISWNLVESFVPDQLLPLKSPNRSELVRNGQNFRAAHRSATAEAAVRTRVTRGGSPLRGSNRHMTTHSYGSRHGLTSAATPWLNRWGPRLQVRAAGSPRIRCPGLRCQRATRAWPVELVSARRAMELAGKG